MKCIGPTTIITLTAEEQQKVAYYDKVTENQWETFDIQTDFEKVNTFYLEDYLSQLAK